MITRTHDEIRLDYVAKLGPDLGVGYHTLYEQLLELRAKWQQYVELFGTSEARVDLLNRTAPWFFHIVQDDLFEATMLHLCRFTDPEQPRQRRLSVQTLLTLAPRVRQEMEPLVQTAIDATAFARDWRNRRIAHLDYDHATNPQARPLDPASRQNVADAIEAIHRVLEVIATRLLAEVLPAEPPFVPHAGARELLYVIRDWLEFDVERKERFLAGQWKGPLHRPLDE